MNIIFTTQAEHLAGSFKDELGVRVIKIDKNKDGKRCFPDGEVYVRISEISEINEELVIVHAGSPEPNQGLVELEMILDVLKEKDIKPKLFFTYFPFAMQDKAKKIGELNVAESLLKKFTEYYHVKKISIIDAHFGGADWVGKYPVENISAIDLLKQEVEKDYPEIVYVSPDMGGEKRTGIKGVEKTRVNSYDIEYESSNWLKEKVEGKNVGVIDDLLETGGTMVKFFDECKKNGAKDVVAILTHGVLREGIHRVKEKYNKLYFTDTINHEEANIKVSQLLRRFLS